MKHDDFKIGSFFICGGRRWKVTDIGTRTVIAIEEREGWMAGPPYALAETVFDENDMVVCEVSRPLLGPVPAMGGRP